MINQEQTLEHLYRELVKLDFNSCLILQASLAEHIHHRWQYANLTADQKAALKEKHATALSH